jgi:hypothetical protein
MKIDDFKLNNKKVYNILILKNALMKWILKKSSLINN